MDNELAELNQQANQYADVLEAAAQRLRSGEPWPMRMDEVGNLLVPVVGDPPMPGPADVTVLVMRRNELLQNLLTKAI